MKNYWLVAFYCFEVISNRVTLVRAFAGLLPTKSKESTQRNSSRNPSRIRLDQNVDQLYDTKSIDPLIYDILQDEITSSLESLAGLLESSEGIRAWRHALIKGRLPTDGDFVVGKPWPREPLFSKLCDCMVTLQLPRFALRHPDVVTVILLSVLRMTIAFSNRLQSLDKGLDADSRDSNDDEDEEEDFYFLEWKKQFQSNSEPNLLGQIEALDDEGIIAGQLTQDLLQEWSGVVNGVGILDNLFGFDHGLLQVNNGNDDGTSGADVGFGIQDGIWSHTGWKDIPQLQQELANLSELNSLIQSLGRRPTVKDSDRIQKFAPRKQKQDGALGAEFDPQLRESIEGLTYSGSFSDMLPSEALLLCGKAKAFRRLFLAKKVESKLFSHQLSGWTDVPSIPRTNSLYRNQLPSAPGGPIIVCLDTSWSMSGRREALSKAVVLSCVSAAHKQGRDCQVVAFSTEKGVMDSGILTAKSNGGIQRLLDFLSHSFGGGTDVTGALKFAITSLEDELVNAADILLVTDGEIPDPPVSEKLMEALDLWKIKKGVQVHGLLIGRSESKPLSRLCTTTHTFLSSYDLSFAASEPRRSATPRGRTSTALYAKRSSFEDDDDWKFKKSNKKRNRWEDDLQDQFVNVEDRISSSELRIDDVPGRPVTTTQFPNAVNTAVDLLRKAAAQVVTEKAWTLSDLDKERSTNEPCWHAHSELQSAVERVEDGLVERGEEARLVVLAMLANEHILLLGSPGTGKSILGLRLAELCDGKFFQRLLTRFTTPEELFGPLSLSSLEKDEYRRCTEGFLPTANVAFLDEIFKANSAILNTLLTILNERKFDNAGGREPCPIRCVVGASNELPENDDLVALFDRFLIRKEVVPVSDEGVLKLLSMSNPGRPSCYARDNNDQCDPLFTESLDGIIEAITNAAETVKIDTAECELMRDLRTYMRQQHSVDISDRRLVKAARLLKISAATDGRSRVDPIDFMLLQHCFWNTPDQRVHVREWLWSNLTPGEGSQGRSLEQFRFLLDNLRNAILSSLRRTSGDVSGDSGGRLEDIKVIHALTSECRRVAAVIQRNLDHLARHIELVRTSDTFLWLDPEDATAMRQLLLPRAESLWQDMRKTLGDAYALELSISTRPEAPANEIRSDVIQELWDEGYIGEAPFTDAELAISMKEAKTKYDTDTFRRWKRAKRKAEQES